MSDETETRRSSTTPDTAEVFSGAAEVRSRYTEGDPASGRIVVLQDSDATRSTAASVIYLRAAGRSIFTRVNPSGPSDCEVVNKALAPYEIINGTIRFPFVRGLPVRLDCLENREVPRRGIRRAYPCGRRHDACMDVDPIDRQPDGRTMTCTDLAKFATRIPAAQTRGPRSTRRVCWRRSSASSADQGRQHRQAMPGSGRQAESVEILSGEEDRQELRARLWCNCNSPRAPTGGAA